MNPIVEAVLFALSGVGAVAAGIAVFRVDSMARATFALLASFILAAVPVLLLGLAFLGIIIVLMMIMEMMAMLIFMIMLMMNPAGLMPMKMIHNNRWSIGIAVGAFVLLGGGALLTPWKILGPPGDADPSRTLGMDLMGPHMLVMIGLGLVLFAGIVAAVALTVPKGRYRRYGDDLRRATPDDPIRGGVGR